MSERCVIFDIDGTLSDPTHRLHHVKGGAKNWPAFFDEMAAMGCMSPSAGCSGLLRIMTCESSSFRGGQKPIGPRRKPG